MKTMKTVRILVIVFSDTEAVERKKCIGGANNFEDCEDVADVVNSLKKKDPTDYTFWLQLTVVLICCCCCVSCLI